MESKSCIGNGLDRSYDYSNYDYLIFIHIEGLRREIILLEQAGSIIKQLSKQAIYDLYQYTKLCQYKLTINNT